MASKKMILDNPTRMSLHERFTFLRKNDTRLRTPGDRVADQLASRKNRRLALQLEQRENLVAALKKQKTVSRGITIRERLSLPRAFVARRRGARAGYVNVTWKSPLLRNQRRQRLGLDNMSNLSAVDSLDVPSNNVIAARRARSPFRTDRRLSGVSRARSVSRSRDRRARMRSRSPFPQRFMGGSQYISRGRGRFRGKRGQFFANKRSENHDFRGKSGGFRGRGRGRGRSRGRGGGRYGFKSRNNPVPSKEELDEQLDQYMATSKASLDKDMDTYMRDEGSWE